MQFHLSGIFGRGLNTLPFSMIHSIVNFTTVSIFDAFFNYLMFAQSCLGSEYSIVYNNCFVSFNFRHTAISH